MPDEYDEDTEAAAADDSALTTMRSAIEEAQSEEEGVSVEVGAPVTEEPDDELGGEEAPMGRRAKKRQRGETHRREQREEVAGLREQLAEMRGQMSAMSATQQQQGQHQQQAQPSADPYEDRKSAVQKARQETVNGYQRALAGYSSTGKTMPQDEEATWLSQNDKHTEDLADIRFDKRQAALDTPGQRAHNSLQAQYPDVMSNPKAREWAIASYRMKEIAGDVTSGEAGGIEQVMNEARKQFRIGRAGAPPPTDKQVSSYGRSARGGGPPKKGARVTLTPEDEIMAMAFSSHLDLNKAQKYQRFANEVMAKR